MIRRTSKLNNLYGKINKIIKDKKNDSKNIENNLILNGIDVKPFLKLENSHKNNSLGANSNLQNQKKDNNNKKKSDKVPIKLNKKITKNNFMEKERIDNKEKNIENQIKEIKGEAKKTKKQIEKEKKINNEKNFNIFLKTINEEYNIPNNDNKESDNNESKLTNKYSINNVFEGLNKRNNFNDSYLGEEYEQIYKESPIDKNIKGSIKMYKAISYFKKNS